MFNSIISSQSFIKRAKGVYVSDRIVYGNNKTEVTKVMGEKPLVIDPKWPLTIFRYMPFSRLFTELNEQTITFVSPNLWIDPFESAFYSLYKSHDVKCLCFTYNGSIGEEWAWKAYKDGQQLVRIEILFDEFVNVLSAIAMANKDWTFYITVCDYSLDRNTIISCYNSAKKLGRKLTLVEFLNLMSLKRKAFNTERELRVFAVSNTINGDANKSFKDVDYTPFMPRVLMEPLSPFTDDLRRKYYGQLQMIHNEGISNFLNKKGFKPQQSHLYEIK